MSVQTPTPPPLPGELELESLRPDAPPRADDAVTKAVAKLIRCDIVIVDNVGMLPVSPDAAGALFRVVDAAYERRS
jgi:hypothetical protein